MSVSCAADVARCEMPFCASSSLAVAVADETSGVKKSEKRLLTPCLVSSSMAREMTWSESA